VFIPLTPLRFLHRAVDLYPNKIGVICGGHEFTYSEFGQRCERLAAGLVAEGVAPGDRVAYLSFNTHRLLEGYFGVPQARAVLCPLNVRLTALELGDLLNHSGASTLIFEEEFAPLVADFRMRCPALKLYIGADSSSAADLTYEELLQRATPERADIFAYDENSIAELFYTGGSTGKPKGVMLSHRTLYLHAMGAAVLSKDPETAVDLYTIPLFHANGWGHPHIAALLGIRQIMVRRFEPGQVLRLIERYGATEMNLIPLMARMILQVPDAQSFARGSMRDIHIGGAPCSPQLIARMERLFPNARCISGYGLTETSPFLSYPRPSKTEAESPEARHERVSAAGWPIVGARIRLVDSHRNDIPRDGITVGEIIAQGDNVMDGYFGEPALTAAAIKNNWLHTGDLAVWDNDGTIRFVDRSKDLIVSGGENISSVEVENAIAHHPAVQECAVIGVPHQTWGEVPLAIVVLRPQQTLAAEDLLAFLRPHLAGFKLPRRVEFSEEALPRSATLKVKKMLLREKYWGGELDRVRG